MPPEKILIIKKREEDKLKLKVTDKVNNNYTHTDYNSVINLMDYKQMAQFFHDMSLMFDAPIEKAFKEYQKSNVPFW
jgi:hypothetical protein